MLKDAVDKFYESIIDLKSKNKLEWFKKFPNECCSETALMLANYLSTECHFKDIVRVSSVWLWNDKLPDWHHYWIKVKNIHVDITYSQFDKSFDIIVSSIHPIITGESIIFKSNCSKKLDLDINEYPYSFTEFNQDEMKQFHGIYNLIIKNIKN